MLLRELLLPAATPPTAASCLLDPVQQQCLFAVHILLV